MAGRRLISHPLIGSDALLVNFGKVLQLHVRHSAYPDKGRLQFIRAVCRNKNIYFYAIYVVFMRLHMLNI